MKKKKGWAKWLLLGLYILAVAVYLVVCFIKWSTMSRAFASGNIEPQMLQLEDFTQVSILPVENSKQSFVSTDSDPQLIYSQEVPFWVDRVTFSASSQKPGGEIVLYYAEDDSYLTHGFSEENKIWAKQQTDGSWYFDLEGKEVQALRLDPDTTGGIVWKVESIQLNAEKPMRDYFIPNGKAIFFLFAVPLLLCAIIIYIAQILAELRQGGNTAKKGGHKKQFSKKGAKENMNGTKKEKIVYTRERK